MVFYTVEFLISYFISAIAYAFCNLTFRKILLLVMNTIFYIYVGSYGFIYLVFITVLSFVATALKDKRMILGSGAITLFGLLIFKYISLPKSILVPVGLSFFTFKVLSVLMDAYRDNYKKVNIVDYYIYVSFFPQILSGPIERIDSFVEKLNHLNQAIEYKQLKTGFILFVFGIFEKIILCERVTYIANTILDNASEYKGITILFGMIAYSFVIYLDFDSYSNMANGLSNMLGFGSVRNFNVPYLAINLSDFWRRWHISLSSWFKDYVYIPLGGNRKHIYINLMIVSILSGLWHGNTLNFLIWGFMHGLCQVIAKYYHFYVTKRLKKSVQMLATPLSIGFTFLVVTYLWVFFRMSHFSDAMLIFKQLFSFNLKLDLSMFDPFELKITLYLILLFILSDIFRYFTKGMETFNKIPFIFRWAIYAFVIICFVILIDFDSGVTVTEFIYGQF